MAVYVGDVFTEFSSVAYYSPQFPRGGMSVSFLFYVFALTSGVTNITVTIEHKNIEDTAWTTLASAGFTAAGLQTPISGTNVKEVLRIKYVVNATNDYDAVYMNTLAPVWQPF